MRTTMSDTNTFLTHTIGRGLKDERYAVERFKSTAEGKSLPTPAGQANAIRRVPPGYPSSAVHAGSIAAAISGAFPLSPSWESSPHRYMWYHSLR